MPKIVYIVPAWSDQAGQCRIVFREGGNVDAPRHYKEHSDEWKECGIMNSRGKVVCYDGSPAEWQELRDCEPLMAGTTFHFE